MIYDTLTKREKEVLDYVVDGLSNDEIARLLFVCYDRVGTIVMNLYDKYMIDTQPKRVKLVLKRLEEMGIDYKKMPPAKVGI